MIDGLDGDAGISDISSIFNRLRAFVYAPYQGTATWLTPSLKKAHQQHANIQFTL